MKKTKQQIWEDWKSQPCSHCRQTYHQCQMDAHHVDPSQKENDGNFSIFSATKEVMVQELAKCIPLCKNCHALLHWKERAEQRALKEVENTREALGRAERDSCAWPRPVIPVASRHCPTSKAPRVFLDMVKKKRDGWLLRQIACYYGITYSKVLQIMKIHDRP